MISVCVVATRNIVFSLGPIVIKSCAIVSVVVSWHNKYDCILISTTSTKSEHCEGQLYQVSFLYFYVLTSQKTIGSLLLYISTGVGGPIILRDFYICKNKGGKNVQLLVTAIFTQFPNTYNRVMRKTTLIATVCVHWTLSAIHHIHIS